MSKNKRDQQFVNKYVPKSPSSSPHRYDQDSFEAEQLSRQLPNPTFQMNSNYELTFKKQMQEQYFSKDPRMQVNKALFSNSQNSLVDCLRQPIEAYYFKSLQELTNLPFADLMSLSLQPFLKEKIDLIGQILQVKRMSMKKSSVSINIKCLKVKENLAYQDKNRVFLLQLLQKQLSKKLFLESLKLNQTHNLFLRQHAQKQESFINNTPNNENSHQVIEQQPYIQASSRHPPSYYSQQQSMVQQNTKQKMMIFIQQVNHILQKVLFHSFNKIHQYTPIQQQSNYLKNVSYNQFESIPLISRPNFNDQSQYSNQTRNKEILQAQISQSKLEELFSYIQALHDQCAYSTNIVKKYFIKWKIYLLESVARSLINKMNPNSMNGIQQQGTQSRHQQAYQQEQQLQYSQGNRESRLTSQLSQAEGTLKTQKKQLKEYLKKNKIITFYRRLRNYLERRKISMVCASMFKENIARNAFQALKQNVAQQQFQRQMQEYYEQISNNQVEDDKASKLFYKTNLLFNYFKRFKQHFRASKLCKTTQTAVLKTAFRQIIFHSILLKRQNQIAARRLLYFRNRLMFKYFNYWKQSYLNQHAFSNRVKVYLTYKNKETLQTYFSLLKLQFKRGLLKSKKALKFYQNNLKANIFYAFKEVYEDSRSFNERTERLTNYLLFSKGCFFMRQFKQYYEDYIQYQRFSIKQQKLRRTLIKLHALQSLKSWRKNQLKKQAYEAIEMKLVRLHNKKRKRQIWSQWRQKALNIQFKSGSSNKSQKHKDWLVQYYGNLCSVMPSPS